MNQVDPSSAKPPLAAESMKAEKPIPFEYITDSVLHVRLRCPVCGSPVKQIHQDPDARDSLLLGLLGEPLIWIAAGLGALVGFMSEAVVLAIFVFLVVAALGYHRQVTRSTYLCFRCISHFSYEAARTAGRR